MVELKKSKKFIIFHIIYLIIKYERGKYVKKKNNEYALTDVSKI